jgi:hypothetical protein
MGCGRRQSDSLKTPRTRLGEGKDDHEMQEVYGNDASARREYEPTFCSIDFENPAIRFDAKLQESLFKS